MAGRMIFGIVFTLFLYLLIAFSMLTQISGEPKLIPREVLFGNPVKAAPEISPDGKKLAYLAPLEGVLNIWVRTLGTADDHPVTKDKGRGIATYFWRENSEHILYRQDTEGDENWRLYSVDLATGAVQTLTPFDEVQVRILKHDKHFPND